MPGWTTWVLSDQAKINECAEVLYVAGYPSDTKRGHDMATPPNPVRNILIHIPGDDLNPKTATLGQVVVLMGNLLLVLTVEDYEASPFYEEP